MTDEDLADVNARDTGDKATPLHFAAGQGLPNSVRVLLNAGADVHGLGDAHHNGVIGWASRAGNEEVVDLLLNHGARHHIFSAIASVTCKWLTGSFAMIGRAWCNDDPASKMAKRRCIRQSHRLMV